jgi:3-hydroxyacyl-[acyl-carrier-protein] dehydratase
VDRLDILDIMHYLPHRFPFLLVDRVTDHEPGKFLEAFKNVSINEPFFQGHFPIKPVMPGVLILEALAQATGLLAYKTEEQRGDLLPPGRKRLYLFVGVDEARFRRQVEPGDQLQMRVELQRVVRGIWRFQAEAQVDGELCCSALLMTAGKEADA